MERYSLYIADNKVDLDDNSFILFNYTMEDLSNPTIVRNSFTKQITLKGTSANNQIFGNLYRADRRTTFGDGYTGVAFDPLRKTPFTIYNEMNEIIESGYVKVDSINKVSGGYEYKITLYGGLGSFFYGLTYDSDGNKRTLGNLVWSQHDGALATLRGGMLDKETLYNGAWAFLRDGESYWNEHPNDYWDIINFAPCYNGLPSDFDSNKVLFNKASYPFNKTSGVLDGKTYGIKSGCTSALATLTNNHTEWEVRCIQPYLQRPVIRIKAIMDAIVYDGQMNGFSVTIHESIRNEKIFKDGWITLPIQKKEDRNQFGWISSILRGSLTPCDYLLSIAKMCGLIFLYDPATKNISLIPRNLFFNGENIDIDNRIDINSIRITPLVASSKWYRMGGDKVIGEEAKNYQEKYGREYGEQRINTGYEFNSDITPLTKDIPLIGAADVTERNKTFGYAYLLSVVHPLVITEEVKVQLWDRESGNSQEFTYYDAGTPIYPWGDKQLYEDWFPKVQFHQAENKAESGEHCVVFFNGWKVSSFDQVVYYIGDDHPDIGALNNGTPCWNMDKDQCLVVRGFPSFNRVSDGYSLDWGIPLETYTKESMDDVLTLYDRFWKAYLTDRYDVDNRIMSCKVNLSGMQVGQQLMRHFFFYENAIWVLNKISNHSMTTDDLTECEFVKVKDIKNYTEGQKL